MQWRKTEKNVAGSVMVVGRAGSLRIKKLIGCHNATYVDFQWQTKIAMFGHCQCAHHYVPYEVVCFCFFMTCDWNENA